MTIALARATSALNADHANPISLTLPGGTAPTIGNTLVLMLIHTGANCNFTPDNGSWTQVASVTRPIRVYTQSVTGTLSATTSANKDSGNGAIRGCLAEFSGSGPLSFLNQVSVENSVGQPATASITPTAGRNAALLSICMNGWTQVLTPASGMTTFGETGGSSGVTCEFNYRIISGASGSYTIGSTGNDTGTWMLGLSLLEPQAIARNQGVVVI